MEGNMITAVNKLFAIKLATTNVSHLRHRLVDDEN